MPPCFFVHSTLLLFAYTLLFSLLAASECDLDHDFAVCPLPPSTDLDYGIPVDRNESFPSSIVPDHDLLTSIRNQQLYRNNNSGSNGANRTGPATKQAQIVSATSDSSSFFATVTGLATPEQTAAVGYCMRLITASWTSPQPVRVLVNFSVLGSERLLGTAQPTATTRFGPHVWPLALAKSVHGRSLSGPGGFDVSMQLNAATRWYTGTDARPSPGTYDLVTVCLHEVVHGLFMSGSTFLVLSSADSSGYDATQMQTHIGRFDAFLANPDGCNITAYAAQGRNRALGTALTGNNLWFYSNATRIARLHAPRPYAAGSSIYHLSESEYGDGAADLMTPAIATMYAQHSLGPVSTAMLNALRDSARQTGARACEPLADPSVDNSILDGGGGTGTGSNNGNGKGSGTSQPTSSGFVVQIGNQEISGWIIVGAGCGGVALIVVVAMVAVQAASSTRKESPPRRRRRVVDGEVVNFVGDGNQGGIV